MGQARNRAPFEVRKEMAIARNAATATPLARGKRAVSKVTSRLAMLIAATAAFGMSIQKPRGTAARRPK